MYHVNNQRAEQAQMRVNAAPVGAISGEANQAKANRSPEVLERLSGIDYQISRLANVVEQLDDRLLPVLAQNGVVATAEPQKFLPEDQEPRTHVGMMMVSLEKRLSASTDLIEGLIARLGV